MQGFEWSFGWNKDSVNATTPNGGFPYLVDEWNVTKSGEIEIVMDIRNVPDWCASSCEMPTAAVVCNFDLQVGHSPRKHLFTYLLPSDL
jgi:hypothetical protein